MPDALKTPTTKVPGCVADVWAYPIRKEDGTLHFLADSNALTTKGLIALVLLIVQDKSPQEILHTDIEGKLGSLALNTKTQLTGNRASNLPNMIRLIRETATRLAA